MYESEGYAQFRLSCDALATKIRRQIKDRTQARVAAAALSGVLAEVLQRTHDQSPASAEELADTIVTALIEPLGWRVVK